MILRAVLGLTGLLLLGTGCALRKPVDAPPAIASSATTPPPAQEPAVADEATDVAKEPRQADDAERLLAYFERLKRLQGAELAKEYEAARLAYGRSATEYHRTGYAMALSMPGTAFNDDARALELLGPVVKKSDSGLRPLAVLLSTFIQERRRLGGDLAAVQQKLAALKSLERTLIEREQTNPGRK
jgi:hypothetical protein